MALSEQGAVFSWGGGAYGQLGLGDVLSSLSPALVKFNKSVLAIACGVWHSLALTDEGVVGQTGVVWAFGRGSGGELGLGDFECRFVPTVIKGTLLGERVMRISAGGWNSAALTDKGHVFVWGHNQYSQLAASALANKPSPEPRKIETLQMMDASGVSCGPAHMAVVTKDGRLYTWGRGDRGQLGHGLVVDKESVPRLVKAGEEDENGGGGSLRLVSRPIQWLLTSPWI
jgi:alpha-tubulin suppressor-like RCC1 family protein